LDVIRLCRDLPHSQECRVISNQLIRAAASVGANYRAACRGKSSADFINKISVVEEEADESIYWLELLGELGVTGEELSRLRREGDELVAIVVASKKTARRTQAK
jgi:four helix bundle protein